jgi:2-methylcitrate dehydratase PrpD
MQITRESEIVRELVTFAVEMKYEDIPTEVVEIAKAMILKTVAGILVGSINPSGRKMAAVIKNRRLPEEAGVIGFDFKTSLWEAVFLNAFLSHCAEMADDFTVGPLALSLAGKRRLSGKVLIEAVVVGLEVHNRACMFRNKETGFFFIPGGVGPAMAASKILGLDVPQTTAALSLATSTIGITAQNAGTDAHYYETALMTLQGLIAAEMAREGMTGNPNMISFMRSVLGKENVDQEEVTKDLGTEWRVRRHWIKKYPCCFLTHRYIDALTELMQEENITYEDIETVGADIGPAEAFLDRPEPGNDMDLQFSLQHVLGAVMLDGDVRLDHVAEDAVNDPRLKDARRKPRLILYPDRPRTELGKTTVNPCRVMVKTRGGQEFFRERLYPIGSWPEDPLTFAQSKALYAKFVRGVLPEELVERTVNTVASLQNLNDVEELMDMLVFK